MMEYDRAPALALHSSTCAHMPGDAEAWPSTHCACSSHSSGSGRHNFCVPN